MMQPPCGSVFTFSFALGGLPERPHDDEGHEGCHGDASDNRKEYDGKHVSGPEREAGGSRAPPALSGPD